MPSRFEWAYCSNVHIFFSIDSLLEERLNRNLIFNIVVFQSLDDGHIHVSELLQMDPISCHHTNSICSQDFRLLFLDFHVIRYSEIVHRECITSKYRMLRWKMMPNSSVKWDQPGYIQLLEQMLN